MSRGRLRMPTSSAALAGALLAAAVLPGAATGHSLVRPGGAVVSYLSQDATSINTLTVRPSGDGIEFRDPTVDGGIDPGSCTPGEVSGGFIVQVFCPAAGVERLRLDLGEREDSAAVSVSIATTILGGNGADRLTAGPAGDEVSGDDGADELHGGAGDDAIDGGLGSDVLDGGPGADRLISRDGLADVVGCGDGVDIVDADTLDQVSADCETVSRTATAVPSGVDEPGRPVLAVGAETVQRLGRSRRIHVYATSSEQGSVSASGFLDIAGLSVPVKSIDPERVRVGGAGVELTYTLKRDRWRKVRRAARRGRSVVVRLGVVATDLAGNSRKRNAPRIRISAGGRQAQGRGGPAGGAGRSVRSAAAAPVPAPRLIRAPRTTSLRHPEPGDVDGDEVPDAADNCPFVKNGSQINTDVGYTATDPQPVAPEPSPVTMVNGDADGDACDDDDDADGKPDSADNCRVDRNPAQIDEQPKDGFGDVCPRIDSDLDGVIDDDDNCDSTPNPDQQDLDGDDKGDACDRDLDGDRFDNEHDNCPTVYNLEPTDTDGDGLINDQLDRDGDGVGTACDPDESAVAPPGPPDTSAPRAKVRAARTESLAQLRAGMVVAARCSEACAVTSEVVLDRRTAGRLGIAHRRTVASGSARLDGAGKTYAFVTIDRRTSRRLAGRGRLAATLKTTVLDDAGNRRRLGRKLTLRR